MTIRTVEPPRRSALQLALVVLTAVAALALFVKGWNECATAYRQQFDGAESAAGVDDGIVEGVGVAFGIVPLCVMFVFITAALTWKLLYVLSFRRAAGLALLVAVLTCGVALLIVQTQQGGSIFDPATYVIRPIESLRASAAGFAATARSL